MVCYWIEKNYPDFSFQFWTFSQIHIQDDWKLMLFCTNILNLTGDNCISNSSAKSGKPTCRFKSYIIAHTDCPSFNFPFLEKNPLNFLNLRKSRNWATDSNLAVKGHLLWPDQEMAMIQNCLKWWNFLKYTPGVSMRAGKNQQNSCSM